MALDNSKEAVSFDKITARLEGLMDGLNSDHVDVTKVAQKVVEGVYKGVTTVELDKLAAEIAASMTTIHYDYALLAGRIAASDLQKSTTSVFSELIDDMYHYTNPRTGAPAALINETTWSIVLDNAAVLNEAIDYSRDFKFAYFGFKTLERSYLLRMNGKVVERPQHLYMRMAVGIHGDDMPSVLETYRLLSLGIIAHASPTMFNAGTPRPQMSSCFLLAMKDDSIEGIYDTLKDSAIISKSAGGIGLSVHNIRAKGAYIAGTNGESSGLVPMLRVFNNTARYVDQGGNKRPGAMAIYIEPWHADIMEVLKLRNNTGIEEERARDLFYALWVPDLFMKRVEQNATWTLMSPDECPGLPSCHGEEFEALYEKYERNGKGRHVINAQTLWFEILRAQSETGMPYMLYKDACNKKSNQQNLGTIQSSNLCTEIIEYSSSSETAVCNLASIALNTMVTSTGTFDLPMLRRVASQLVFNLNKVVDTTCYPTKEAEYSNLKNRPIGIGVQGLADTFCMLKMAFDSKEAAVLNKSIFETIYYGAVEASVTLAERDGPYDSYEGSPASKGQLQFDLWGVAPFGQWDWDGLKKRMAKAGLRNSLLVAPMPTASTAQILGNNEAIEPFTSNIYARRVLAGEFQMLNRYLMQELIELGLWDETMKSEIIRHKGSVQAIESIPLQVRLRYKTVWEISQKTLIDMAVDRGAYICQSQSFNVHMEDPTSEKLTSMHFYGWRKGVKTGMYYLRTKAASAPLQFTIAATPECTVCSA